MLYLSMLVAVAARLYHLGRQSIWGDESLTLFKYTAGNSLTDFFRHIWKIGVHPPLYFLVGHYWYKLGHSEFMLRFPSMVFGVAAIPVMYALVNRLFGQRAAGISALIIAVSPIHIWYSQEARMYTLQLLLSLTSMLFFVKALQKRRPRDYALYALFTVMAFYTQVATILLIAAQGLFATASSLRDWRKTAAWIGVFAVVALTCAPWLFHSFGSKRVKDDDSIGFVRPASILDVGYTFYAFSAGFSLGPSVAELHDDSTPQMLAKYLPVILFSMPIFGLTAILGLAEARRKNRWNYHLLLAIMIVPVALSAVLTVFKGIPMNPRYMLVSAIPYWIALALGIQRCVEGRLLRVIPGLAAVVVAVSLFNHYRNPEYAKQDVRSAVAQLNAAARPGDVVIISSVEMGGPFIYYFRRRDLPFVGYPPKHGLVDPRALPGDMDKILRQKKRAWLVLGRTWSSDPDDMIRAYFDRRYHPLMSRHYSGVSTFCYDTASKHAQQPAMH